MKKKRFLLINPWVYDFSAFCFWAKPLGLLRLAEYLSQYDVEIIFVDCMEVEKFKKYGTGKYHAEEVEKPEKLKDVPFKYKRYGIKIKDFVERIKKFSPYDAVFVTSIMTYWYPGVFKAIEIVKEEFKDIPVVLGGIYATLCKKHAVLNSNADFIYSGKLSEKFDELLRQIGVNLNKKNKKTPYYFMNFYENLYFAPLLTSEGCPFMCSYCASKVIYKEYLRRDLGEVCQEFAELYKLGVRDFAFYDDALLFEKDKFIKPFLTWVSKNYSDTRFHTPNGLHARFIDEEVAFLFHKTNFKTIRLSLETISPKRQKETGDKVSNDDFIRALNYLKRYGFTKEELGVYLMYGLPGQSIEEVKEGISFLKNLNVRINLAEFSPIPETKSWLLLVEQGLIDDDFDPILTNNSIFTYLFSGYDRKEIFQMKLEVKNYNSN